jgi:Spy/CpxP family protein refolding chaperone
MKKQLVVCAALSALVLATFGVCRACEPQPPPRPVPGNLARVLDLSADQQTRIEAIFAAEREKSAPLMREQADYRKQLHDAALTATFDEAAVRVIAGKLALDEIELTVSHARVENQVNAVLDAQQRALAEKLRPRPGDMGQGHRPPPAEQE